MRALLGLALGAVLYAQEAPTWVREAAAQPAPEYPAKVSTLVLLQEEQVTVEPDGRRIMRERGAVKILERSSGSVTAFRTYNTKSGRIRDFRAWLLPAGGREVVLGKDRILDVALASDYTYDEGRAKAVECPAGSPAGSVFAWEIVEEEKTVFTQYQYSFQNEAPVLVSRFVLSLPPGWESRGTVLNRPPMEPAVSGNTYTWELRNLPWIENEEYSPGTHATAPRLAVDYRPASGQAATLRTLTDWASVSAWISELSDPQAEVTESVRAKAAELTASAGSEIDKIRAIAGFVQAVNYVSVQMNITRGGGYTPHAATQVLSRSYGDCKDKATLMKALLKGAGIDSYVVLVYSGDRRFVQKEWPSPQQFNHAIVAVRVQPQTDLPTVLTHPRLGRLLIFDPTDPFTAAGDLPSEEQGSFALVVAGRQGELLALPLLPPSANRIESDVDAELHPDGRLSARMVRGYFGQSAPYLRSLRRKGGDEVKKYFENSLSDRVGGTAVSSAALSDGSDGRLECAVQFAAAQFGQLMQGRLLILKPGILLPSSPYSMTAKPRTLPVKLQARVRKGTVRLKLPAGFAIDELPDPVDLRGPYGVYKARWTAKDNQVAFEQSLEVNDTLAPAAGFTAIREFFDKVAGAQDSPVVLVRK